MQQLHLCDVSVPLLGTNKTGGLLDIGSGCTINFLPLIGTDYIGEVEEN